MSLAQRLLPQPLITLAILGLWMALAPSITLGGLLMGSIVALSIPLATHRFWPDPPHLARPLAGAALFSRVVGDIIVANWQVARLVLGPLDRIGPAFVEVPLDIKEPFVGTLLGSIVSLTPGTVSIEIDQDRQMLLVHALDVEDPAVLVETIKRRYEAPLKEIFGC